MTVDSEEQLEALKRIGRIVALTLKEMSENLRPGISTQELDDIGLRTLEKHGARSAPRLAYNFPGATCISVNEEAAHGIPGKRIILAGDLVNLDVSAELDGYYADTGASYPVPPVTEATQRLCDCTRAALNSAVRAAKAGRKVSAIGKAVEDQAGKCGYNIIASLSGHGVGHSLHDEPRAVANYFNPYDKRLLKEGQVIAIEPFLTTGNGSIVELPDGWTLCTEDKSPLAQYEHTIVVTKGAPIILTQAA